MLNVDICVLKESINSNFWNIGIRFVLFLGFSLFFANSIYEYNLRVSYKAGQNDPVILQENYRILRKLMSFFYRAIPLYSRLPPSMAPDLPLFGSSIQVPVLSVHTDQIPTYLHDLIRWFLITCAFQLFLSQWFVTESTTDTTTWEAMKAKTARSSYCYCPRPIWLNI